MAPTPPTRRLLPLFAEMRRPFRLRSLASVGADYAISGPNHRVVCQPIRASADTTFRWLEHGPANKKWQGVVVNWTSEPPLGAGSTRTFRGAGQTIEQTVLVWTRGERMCLRSDRATLPLAALSEDFLIASTGPSSCDLTWHYAYEWAGPAERVLGRLFGAAFHIGARRDLKKLARLIE